MLQVINPGPGASAQLQHFGLQGAHVSQASGLPRLDKNYGPTLSVGNTVVQKEMDNLLAAVGAYAEKQKKMRDTEDLVSNLTDLQKSAVDFQTEWKLSHFGVDARDAGSVFSGQVDEMAKDMLEKRFAGRPELQAAFREKAMQISLQGFTHGSAYDSQQDLQYRKQQLDGQMADLQGIIATGTPQDIDAAAQMYRDSLEVLFPGMDHTKDLRDLDKSVYMGMIQRNVTVGNLRSAKVYLDEGIKKQVFSAADIERGTSLIDSGMNKMIAMENRRLAMAERAQRAAALESEKQLVDRYISGDLRPEDVQARRDFLSPSEYRSWAERAITGPKQATTNDKMVYLDLLDKKDRSEDITSDARAAFLDGKITEKTYMELTREATEEENKVFFEYIANALKPSEFNKNPASGQSYANARRDLVLYLKKNPSASYEEKDAMARSIGRRYGLIDTNTTTLALPMPKFFDGSRADIRRQSLDAAAIKTVEAYKAGRITQQEFLEESQRIQALTRAVERLEAGTPATTTKPRGKR